MKKTTGSCVVAVSAPIRFEEKRAELDISRSEAYQRGLQAFFDDAEDNDTVDTLRAKLERASALIERLQKEIKILRKWNEKTILRW